MNIGLSLIPVGSHRLDTTHIFLGPSLCIYLLPVHYCMCFRLEVWDRIGVTIERGWFLQMCISDNVARVGILGRRSTSFLFLSLRLAKLGQFSFERFSSHNDSVKCRFR